MFTRTMVITPHFDDETIGCGGLLASLAKEKKDVLVVEVATHTDTYNYNAGRVVDNEERYLEAERAMMELGLDPDRCLVQLKGFEDGRLDQCDRKSLVTAIDEQIRSFRPTAVLFPYSSHHQDHQAVYHASIAALRPTVDTDFIKLKAMYEYPYINSWSSNLNPNSKLYFTFNESILDKKCRALKAYKSQLVRDPRDILDVRSIILLARTRGTEVCQTYAEAFYPMTIIV